MKINILINSNLLIILWKTTLFIPLEYLEHLTILILYHILHNIFYGFVLMEVYSQSYWFFSQTFYRLELVLWIWSISLAFCQKRMLKKFFCSWSKLTFPHQTTIHKVYKFKREISCLRFRERNLSSVKYRFISFQISIKFNHISIKVKVQCQTTNCPYIWRRVIFLVLPKLWRIVIASTFLAP